MKPYVNETHVYDELDGIADNDLCDLSCRLIKYKTEVVLRIRQ